MSKRGSSAARAISTISSEGMFFSRRKKILIKEHIFRFALNNSLTRCRYILFDVLCRVVQFCYLSAVSPLFEPVLRYCMWYKIYAGGHGSLELARILEVGCFKVCDFIVLQSHTPSCSALSQLTRYWYWACRRDFIGSTEKEVVCLLDRLFQWYRVPLFFPLVLVGLHWYRWKINRAVEWISSPR